MTIETKILTSLLKEKEKVNFGDLHIFTSSFPCLEAEKAIFGNTLGTIIPTSIDDYIVSNWDGVIEKKGIGLVKLNVYMDSFRCLAEKYPINEIATKLIRREYRHLEQIRYINEHKLNAIDIMEKELCIGMLNLDAKLYEIGHIVPIEEAFKNFK